MAALFPRVFDIAPASARRLRTVVALLFLASAPARAAEPAELKIGVLRQPQPRETISILETPAEDETLAGAELGADDNNTTGVFSNQKFTPIDAVAQHLEPGDTVIDGGNSYYIDDIRRAKQLAERDLHYVDVGTSGGVWGLEEGYCQMIGGEREPIERLDPIFAALAPPMEAAERTPGREGGDKGGTAERGYLRCGGAGAGHFVKMVHNGIEYGIMAAYAEGLNILRHANVGATKQDLDAETTPLRDPEHYQYDLDLADIAEVWRRGSVIRSWLLDLTAGALLEQPDLSSFKGRVSDSGEGRWTLKAAIDEAVPANVLAAALSQRFSSRGQADYADKLLSAMRSAFGGHAEKS